MGVEWVSIRTGERGALVAVGGVVVVIAVGGVVDNKESGRRTDGYGRKSTGENLAKT